MVHLEPAPARKKATSMQRRQFLVTAIATTALLAAVPAMAQEPLSLKIGTTVEPRSFDPAQAQEGTQIPYYQAVYDTLLLREPDGSLSPMLATQWSYDDSFTTLTLTLRDDVTFSDGTTFDADDVVASFAHFAQANGPQVNTVSSVKAVNAVSPTEVVIELKEPDPAFLIYLSNAAGFMASSESLGTESLVTTPVGSGPYLLDKDGTTVGSRYHFVRNEAYWGRKLPYDEVDFLVLSDETARLNALRSGQVNTAIMSSAAAGAEAAKAGFTLVPNESDWHGLTFFDRAGTLNPALGDVRVRQAVNYALDRHLLLESFELGQGSVTDQIWGKASLGFVPELDEYYAYDPDRARALLAEAGYGNGLKLTIPVTTIFDDATLVAVQQMLLDVGIEAEYQEIPLADFFGELRSGKQGMTYMWFFQPTDWQLINQFIAPDATWNVFDSSDDVIPGLMDKVQAGSDDDRRVAAQELNRHIVEQAWFAPLYRVVKQLFVDDKTTVVPQAEQAAPSIYNYAPAS